MKPLFPVLLMAAAAGGCVMAPPAPPAPAASAVLAPVQAKAPLELLNFYKDADAYRVSAERRLCANPSAGPRLETLQRRFAAATQALVARYGREQADAARVAVVTSGSDLCTNRAALATSLSSFEAAISDLEAALR
jgi:hypothetical protein